MVIGLGRVQRPHDQPGVAIRSAAFVGVQLGEDPCGFIPRPRNPGTSMNPHHRYRRNLPPLFRCPAGDRRPLEKPGSLSDEFRFCGSQSLAEVIGQKAGRNVAQTSAPDRRILGHPSDRCRQTANVNHSYTMRYEQRPMLKPPRVTCRVLA